MRLSLHTLNVHTQNNKPFYDVITTKLLKGNSTWHSTAFMFRLTLTAHKVKPCKQHPTLQLLWKTKPNKIQTKINPTSTYPSTASVSALTTKAYTTPKSKKMASICLIVTITHTLKKNHHLLISLSTSNMSKTWCYHIKCPNNNMVVLWCFSVWPKSDSKVWETERRK